MSNAEEIYAQFESMLSEGLSAEQAAEVRQRFSHWIQAKLDEYDPELYAEDEYIEDVIPDEIRFLFNGLNRQERREQSLTAHDQLRLSRLSERSYERAKLFLRGTADAGVLADEATDDLVEIKAIEARLSTEFPATYDRVKRQISESKLDCMYVSRGGGAASLRLGRVIQRD